MGRIHRREERKELKQKNKGCGKDPHQGEPIGRANQHVNQSDRPRQEYEYFKQVRDGTAPDGVAAHRQKDRLQGEAKRNHDKVETTAPKNART